MRSQVQRAFPPGGVSALRRLKVLQRSKQVFQRPAARNCRRAARRRAAQAVRRLRLDGTPWRPVLRRAWRFHIGEHPGQAHGRLHFLEDSDETESDTRRCRMGDRRRVRCRSMLAYEPLWIASRRRLAARRAKRRDAVSFDARPRQPLRHESHNERNGAGAIDGRTPQPGLAAAHGLLTIAGGRAVAHPPPLPPAHHCGPSSMADVSASLPCATST